MKEFQQRVVDEREALDGKLNKLCKFLTSDIFKGLPIEEQGRLRRQHSAMDTYSKILGERIVAFEK